MIPNHKATAQSAQQWRMKMITYELLAVQQSVGHKLARSDGDLRVRHFADAMRKGEKERWRMPTARHARWRPLSHKPALCERVVIKF